MLHQAEQFPGVLFGWISLHPKRNDYSPAFLRRDLDRVYLAVVDHDIGFPSQSEMYRKALADRFQFPGQRIF